jgi:tagatose-1,6-bisphosphate aldolase non-catalytic subunit AgaZ/GatZ
MLHKKIEHFIHQRCCTLLGIGPMSKNCVDAVIELSNQYDVPLFLVASRRQIEAREFGGGYVNDWSTEEFARYIYENDKKGRIIMARDHGGPWQSNFEVQNKFSLHQAMESAKRSYQIDIESGFEFIHIDPSIDIWGQPDIDEVLSRVFELYEHCWTVAQRLHKNIFFEIGAEQQSGDIGTLDEVDYVLSHVRTFCQKNHIPFPSFIVVQTGTKVAELKNVGSVSTPLRIAYELPAEIQLPKLVDICNRNSIFLKQHNTDYLNDETLKLYPKLGIHSANVAPEFGTRETLALLDLFDQYKLKPLKEKFLKLAFDSKKWEKWMLPQSNAGDQQKAVIAGHYVFSTSDFVEIKKELKASINGRLVSVDAFLVEEIKKNIMRYLKSFRLLKLNQL